MLNATQGFAYNKFEAPNDWPKIDKTFDYKIENGKLLSGNEHIYLSGPVTYTKVGNPTIVDGVLSNCSSSNHIKLNSPLDYSKDLEIVFKLRFENSYTQEGVILQDLKSIGGVGNGMSIYRNGLRRISIMLSKGYSEGGTWNEFSYNQFPLEEWFYVKYIITSDTMTLYTGSSLDSLTQVVTTTRLGTTTGIDNPLIGYTHYWNIDQMFNEGQIDLKESYIKVNGKLWFYGKNYTTKYMTPVPKGLEYNGITTTEIGWVYTNNELVGSVSRFQEFIPAPEGTMIGKDDTHSLVVETPIVNGELLSPKMVGPVGYTVVGTPTINNGVVSGFSDSNYLTAIPTNNKNPFEYVVCFVPNSFTVPSGIDGMGMANFGDAQFFLSSDKKLKVKYSDGSNRWIAIDNITLEENTKYWGKLSYDSTTIALSLSTDGVSYSTPVTQQRTPRDRGDVTTHLGYVSTAYSLFDGSIDLNETYVKVNGKLWFGKENWTPSTHTDNAIYLLGSHNTDYSTYNTQGINPTIETESDESGTYNIWIDNQEIYKEQSNPLDINWSNLALTTGYNITTPSTLKAHVIKVEPNNGNVTRFSTDTNYKVENGLLTWASPELYLEGPNQYTVVGSPTITNGVISGFSSSNYLDINVNGNFNFNQDFEFQVKFLPNSTSNAPLLVGNSAYYGGIQIVNNYIRFACRKSDGTTNYTLVSTDGVNSGHLYLANVSRVSNTLTLSIYKDGLLIDTVTDDLTNIVFYASAAGHIRLGYTASTGAFDGSIDLNETYITVNGQLWFGKIHTSETDVPVPANFTYGNITTSSNGTVNLTTQEFSPDTLAIYGKDS